MDSETHVGDVGTVYQVPIYDDDLAQATFDPSSASTKKIFFRMPGNDAAISRAATVASITLDGESVYALTYTVLAADVDAENADGAFHTETGPIILQGELVYADGRRWRSNKITTDQQGRVLSVHPNL